MPKRKIENEETEDNLPDGELSGVMDLDKWVLRGASTKYVTYTREDEAELIKRSKAGDKEAMRDLWKGFEQLAARIVRRFANRGVPLCDLMQEAFLGFHEAVMKFREDRGCRLITSANIRIHSAVYSAVQKKGLMVRVTPSKDSKERLRKRKFDALEALQDAANRDGISYASNKDDKQRPFTLGHVSMDKTDGEDQLALHERIACVRAIPDDLIDSSYDITYLREVLSSSNLTEEERQFIDVKWGLWDRSVKTVEEMSTLWRWSIADVQVFEERCFAKIFPNIDISRLSDNYFDKRNRKRFEK